MAALKYGARVGVLGISFLMMSKVVWAQTVGIAGVVKDTSGGVLPGVTVEAASPALIEKVRTAVTDAKGLYSIEDLRPGTYSVTFTLSSFATVKRQGIELSGSFTATVNAVLMVGSVQETITVSGAAPTVDIHNDVQQLVVLQTVQDSVASGRYILALSELTPGVITSGSGSATGHDVAGLAAERGASMIHGSRSADSSVQLLGAPSTLGGAATSAAWQADPLEVQEYDEEVGALSAEVWGGGVRINVIPKEGGNRFSGGFYVAALNHNFEANNITPALMAAGLQTPNPTTEFWDVDAAVGGPILRDRLWFFSNTRNWGDDQQVAGMFKMINPLAFTFNPQLGAAGNANVSSPAYNLERDRAYGTRLTWQATQKNKFSLYVANQPRGLGPTNGNPSGCACAAAITGTTSYEAGYIQPDEVNYMIQGRWTAPLTSNLLFEAMADNTLYDTTRGPGPENQYTINDDVISVTDSGTGYSFRSKMGAYDKIYWSDNIATASLSYITGTHTLKFGVQFEYGGIKDDGITQIGGETYQLKNGVPTGLTVFNGPYDSLEYFKKTGLFVQDRLTLGRLTVNAGLRFDWQLGSIDQESSGPNAFAGTNLSVPYQTWPALNDVPDWKDLSPRLGVTYDLFGNGKTALKATLSKYVVTDGTAFQTAVNPVLFNQSAQMSWADSYAPGSPNYYVPQPSELGPLTNSAFGTAATTTQVDPAYRDGWNVRQHNWETSVAIQRELAQGMSVSFGYTRRWYDNFFVTDNQAIPPSDYDQYCITAPTNSGLGGVSGGRICGLYDLNPAYRSVTPNNIVENANHFGTETESWSGIDLTFQARLPGHPGTFVRGGLDRGTGGNNASQNNISACFVYSSPENLRFCDVHQPWQNNIKLLGNAAFPWGVTLGATFQEIPEAQILANYTVTNAMIASGAVQFLNNAGSHTTFTGGSQVVPLLAPGTNFLPYLYQVDIRLTKDFRYRGIRGKLALDVANLLNGSGIQLANNTYGASWQRPTYILQGRVFKPGLTLEF